MGIHAEIDQNIFIYRSSGQPHRTVNRLKKEI